MFRFRSNVFAPLLVASLVSGAMAMGGEWRAAKAQTPSSQQPAADVVPLPPLPKSMPAQPAPAPAPPAAAPKPAPEEEPEAPPTPAPAPTRRVKRTIEEYDEPVPVQRVTHTTTSVTRDVPIAAPAPVPAAAPVVPTRYVTRYQIVRKQFALVEVPQAAIQVSYAPVAAPLNFATPPVAPPVTPIVTPSTQTVLAPAKTCRGPIMRTFDAAGAAVSTWWAR